MTFLVWTFRILVILLILRFVIRLVTQMNKPARRRSGPPAERSGGTLVRDPQCGTYIAPDRALALSTGGGTVYFCSTACRDEWKAASAVKVRNSSSHA
jgi:YHS domain-containing protein